MSGSGKRLDFSSLLIFAQKNSSFFSLDSIPFSQGIPPLISVWNVRFISRWVSFLWVRPPYLYSSIPKNFKVSVSMPSSSSNSLFKAVVADPPNSTCPPGRKVLSSPFAWAKRISSSSISKLLLLVLLFAFQVASHTSSTGFV